MRQPVAVDLFAGVGGLTEGLRMTGFYVALACDSSPSVTATHELNHPETRFFRADLTDITLEQLRVELELCSRPIVPQDIDLVAGGPPCQGFSVIGPRDPQDERNALIFTFAELVVAIQPKAFLMENVVGLLSTKTNAGRVLHHMLRILTMSGYMITTPVRALSAADYGVPQLRRRVFILGVHRDLAHSLPWGMLRYPARTHYSRAEAVHDPPMFRDDVRLHTTLEEAIGDLPAKPAGQGYTVPYPPCPQLSPYQALMRAESPAVLYNHHTKGAQEIRLRRIRALREQGSNRTDLPPELQCGGLKGKYRRLRYSEPSPTLTAHIGKDLSDFIHPRHDRWITVREAARIQSFPDRYVLCGKEALQLRTMGNAVPPLLAAAVAYQVGQDLGLNVTAPSQWAPLSAGEVVETPAAVGYGTGIRPSVG